MDNKNKNARKYKDSSFNSENITLQMRETYTTFLHFSCQTNFFFLKK